MKVFKIVKIVALMLFYLLWNQNQGQAQDSSYVINVKVIDDETNQPVSGEFELFRKGDRTYSLYSDDKGECSFTLEGYSLEKIKDIKFQVTWRMPDNKEFIVRSVQPYPYLNKPLILHLAYRIGQSEIDQKKEVKDSIKKVNSKYESYLINVKIIDNKIKKPVSGKFKISRSDRTYNLYSNDKGECSFNVEEYPKRKFRTAQFKVIWEMPDQKEFTVKRIRLYPHLNKPLILHLKPAEPYIVSTEIKGFKYKGIHYLLWDIDEALYYTLIPTFNINIGRNILSEAGIVYSPGRNLDGNYYARAGMEFNYRKHFVMGPKLSFHYRYLIFLESGINSIWYTDFKNSAFVIRPETGLSVLGVLGIHYGYNFRVNENSAIDKYINGHNINLYLRLILK
jgi:hypothetical protein